MFRSSHKSHVENERPEWLKVIWECNRLTEGEMFGQPVIEPWWAGGTVEEYPTARVIFVGDESVRVVGKTEEADEIIRQAAATLGYYVAP